MKKKKVFRKIGLKMTDSMVTISKTTELGSMTMRISLQEWNKLRKGV